MKNRKKRRRKKINECILLFAVLYQCAFHKNEIKKEVIEFIFSGK